MVSDPRFGPAAIARGEQHLQSQVEFRLGGFDVPLFELFLAGFEMSVRGGDEGENLVSPSGRGRLGAHGYRQRHHEEGDQRGQRTALPEQLEHC